MDLNHVTAFARVVKDGSFTAAAKSLGAPKSSISRSVAQLERDLGVRLLHRTTRKIHLTDAGGAFYERVARALADIDDATVAAADTQSEIRGAIRLTAPVDYGMWSLAPVVARFVRANPGIVVDVTLTSRLVDLVAEGFDLAVRAGPLRESSLVARKLPMLSGAIYASARYVARHGEPRTIADLAAHEAVLFRPQAGRWELVGADGERVSAAVKGRISVDDLSFVRKCVLAGAGIGLIPDFLCAREIENGRMVRLLPAWSMHGAALHLVYPSARFVPHRVVAFREFLQAELAKQATRCEARGRRRK